MQRTVMKQEGIEMVYEDVPISVAPDGRCSVDVVVIAACAPGVCNTAENTSIVCPDAILPQGDQQRSLVLTKLISSTCKVNRKLFVVGNSKAADSTTACLHALNEKNPRYTDELVEKTNLYCVDLEAKNEFKQASSDLKIDIVKPENKEQCAEVSEFQLKTLPWFRKLTQEQIIKKAQERYMLDAFNTRVASPEITIFTLEKDGKLLGTFTLNVHRTKDAPESERFGYLSDLFVAEGIDNNPILLNQFISGVFSKIVEKFSKIKVLSVMAASGDSTIPIVKCFDHAREAGLIYRFTRAEQERLGVVAHFTLRPENGSNAHLPYLAPGTVSMLAEKTVVEPAASFHPSTKQTLRF